jgi:hypothetical protein
MLDVENDMVSVVFINNEKYHGPFLADMYILVMG